MCDALLATFMAENVMMKRVSEETGFDLHLDATDGDWLAEISPSKTTIA